VIHMASHKPLLFFVLAIALLVTPVITAPALAASLSVTTDKASYNLGQTVVISGQATAGAAVTVQVVNPAGTTIFTDVVTATSAGILTTSFRLPQDAPTGTYTVYASATEGSASKSFTVTAATAPTAPTALSVAVDGGDIYFRGETAEFYILVSYNGALVEANVSTGLYGPTGAPMTGARIAKGLYTTTLAIPAGASAGTYTLVANASTTLDGYRVSGVALKSFIISPTLTGWNAKLISINGTVAEIKTDVRIIKMNLTTIGAKITSINGSIVEISTAVGKIKGYVEDVNDGGLATIYTELGTVKMDVADIKKQFPITVDMTPVWIAVVFSLVAALAAVYAVITISRKIAG
jgi:hypothetical protein